MAIDKLTTTPMPIDLLNKVNELVDNSNSDYHYFATTSDICGISWHFIGPPYFDGGIVIDRQDGLTRVAMSASKPDFHLWVQQPATQTLPAVHNTVVLTASDTVGSYDNGTIVITVAG